MTGIYRPYQAEHGWPKKKWNFATPIHTTHLFFNQDTWSWNGRLNRYRHPSSDPRKHKGFSVGKASWSYELGLGSLRLNVRIFCTHFCFGSVRTLFSVWINHSPSFFLPSRAFIRYIIIAWLIGLLQLVQLVLQLPLLSDLFSFSHWTPTGHSQISQNGFEVLDLALRGRVWFEFLFPSFINTTSRNIRLIEDRSSRAVLSACILHNRKYPYIPTVREWYVPLIVWFLLQTCHLMMQPLSKGPK